MQLIIFMHTLKEHILRIKRFECNFLRKKLCTFALLFEFRSYKNKNCSFVVCHVSLNGVILKNAIPNNFTIVTAVHMNFGSDFGYFQKLHKRKKKKVEEKQIFREKIPMFRF